MVFVLTRVILLILLICMPVSAQVDSLIQVLRSSEGEEKTEVLLELIRTRSLVLDERLTYANTALREAATLGDSLLTAEILLERGNAYYQNQDYQSARKDYEQALGIASRHFASRLLGDIHYQLGWLYNKISDNELAEYHYKKSIELREKLGLKKELGDSYNYTGMFYWATGKYDSALKYYERGLEIREEIHDSASIGKSHNNIAIIYWYWAMYDIALEHYHQALAVREAIGDSSGVVLVLTNMGLLYREWGYYDMAREYLFEAVDINKHLQNRDRQGYLFISLGEMYLDVGKPDSAMILFEKAHKEYTKLGIAKHLVLIKNNIARAMLKLDQVDDARAILFESIAISDSSGNKRLKADALNLLGEAEIMRNNYRRAIEYLTEAADINSELQRKEKLADDFFHLSIANENAGNYKEALFYHKRFSELQDSIHISDINRKILNYKLRYELEKNDRELQAKQFEVDRQTVLTNLLFGSIGALMIIIIVIGIINRKRLSANKSLQEQNDKISKQNNEINRQKRLLEEQQEELRVINEELEKANEELKSLNITKDKFFSIVSHDLKNPFQALLGYTKMLDIEYEDMDDDQRQSIIRILFDVSQRSFRLVDNLLNWSRTQLNRVYMNPANLQLQKNIRFVEEALKTAFESKNITFTNDVANDTEVYADKDALNLILRNLIANAIKFTPQNGKITVGSRSSNGYIEISVSDTGIGIPGEIQKDLFNLDRNMNTKGTEDEEGTGLGLILCKEFVERSGGEIRVESQKGKGTTFSFTLPENIYEK